MRVTAVRAFYGQHTEAFKQNGYVGIGWFDEPLDNTGDREQIRARYQAEYSDQSQYQVGQNTGQIYRFLNEIPKGSVVLTPYQPPDTRILVGKVMGPAYFEKDSTSPFYYRLPVEWQAEPLDRHALSVPLQNTLGSLLTVFNVKQAAAVCAAAELPYDGGKDAQAVAKAVQTSTDASYRAVHETLCELDPYEFELLVSYVLRTLGFVASQETGRSGDGGVDFEGELSVYGVASVQLQVQVKRYDTQKIGEREIRNFRGALKRDRQGCFITLSDFQKKARTSANDSDKVPINLINGRQFVEIMTEQYDRIMDLMRAEDNDDLAEKLRFRRALIPA